MMGGKQLMKSIGLILCWVGNLFGVTVLASSSSNMTELESVHGGNAKDEAAYLRKHTRDLYKVIECQEELLEQAEKGELPDNISGYCSGKYSVSPKNNHTVSRFHMVFDQFLGISSSALTAAPPIGNIVVNLYLVCKGKADKVNKKDFVWPVLDIIANAVNIGYFLHGRYEMGRKGGDEDITSQSVAIGFDMATMVLMFVIMRWQKRQVTSQFEYLEHPF